MEQSHSGAGLRASVVLVVHTLESQFWQKAAPPKAAQNDSVTGVGFLKFGGGLGERDYSRMHLTKGFTDADRHFVGRQC